MPVGRGAASPPHRAAVFAPTRPAAGGQPEDQRAIQTVLILKRQDGNRIASPSHGFGIARRQQITDSIQPATTSVLPPLLGRVPPADWLRTEKNWRGNRAAGCADRAGPLRPTPSWCRAPARPGRAVVSLFILPSSKNKEPSAAPAVVPGLRPSCGWTPRARLCWWVVATPVAVQLISSSGFSAACGLKFPVLQRILPR